MAADPFVKVGQIDISSANQSSASGPGTIVYGIRPFRGQFSLAQLGNLLYLLDSKGPGASDANGHVTRVELRPAEEPGPWTFALEYSLTGP